MARHLKRIETSFSTLSTPAGDISFSLTRSIKRRSIEISINPSSYVRVIAPRHVVEDEIHNFIQQKAAWIVQKLKETRHKREIIEKRKYDHGHKFLFLGDMYELEIKEDGRTSARIHFDGRKWQITLPAGKPQEEKRHLVKTKLHQWYREQAKEIFASRIFHYSRIMELYPVKIAVKRQRRIWGSCHPKHKTINLNYHLILSPLHVIDYVVVHELCHLEVANHSKRFWNKVAKVLPDYKIRQQWLKAHAMEMAMP